MATKKRAAKREVSSADAVDEQLARYRSMRDFNVTSEPAGGAKSKSKTLPFVIQKHAASHLHYDFRLGWNGVLKSWAVAKGPSYSVKDRRLAVQVEDHPMEYGGFEGTIPKGQYGGGTVMVWDQGTWRPQAGYEDVDAGLRDGHLKFAMDGTKMHGKWALVRMQEKPGSKWGRSDKPNWLLIKEHDEFEGSDGAKSVTDGMPDSVVTGRSLEEIASEEDHVWNSKDTAKKGQAWERREGRDAGLSTAAQKRASGREDKGLAKLPKEKQPEFVAPQLAMEAAEPPEKSGWLHELKLDGYRVQARKAGDTVQLLTRKGLDWTHRMRSVADSVEQVAARDCTLDGEVVVLGADGNSSFADLQASFQDGAKHPLSYFVFDLLHLDGHSTRGLPLVERKRMLAEILPKGDETIRLSEHLEGDAAKVLHHACELHAEGIVSKRAEAAYRGTRNADWLKSKCLHEQEFVVVGYTVSTEGEDRIGSLLLGYYEGKTLVYAGRTGTGFTQKLKRDLMLQLQAMTVKKHEVERVPAEAKHGAVWVKPKLVAQVRFATWTADNLVRQAAFLGMREDKPASEVVREEASVSPKSKTAKPKSAKPKSAEIKSSTTTAIRLTHPEKVLDPESGLTKRELAEYYAAIAEHMLPHIAGRPLSLVRCPEGAGKPCFFQKHVTAMLPKGIGTVQVPDKKTGKPEPYITLDTPDALMGLAQMGVLEVHPWGSRNDDLEHPDRMILDLDPDESLPWGVLCEAAADARRRLKKLGLESFLKLTGGKGLHIVAPIEPTLSWTELKQAAHNFVLAMERERPELYLTKMTKSARRGKIYLDYLRNERGATAVAPFSPRARLGVHVSLPLPWTALKESKRPAFRVRDFAEWKSRLKSDPWKAMLGTKQRLEPEHFG
jgi:bifunctional non-homologous end joining protein LigD